MESGNGINSQTLLNIAKENDTTQQRFLDTIPDFYGNGNELPYFIKTAEALITKFYNATDPQSYDNFVLLANVRNKVKGEALTAILNYSINLWTDLRNALLTSYSDKRDCYTKAIEMSNLRQTNETAFEFHNKMLLLLNAHTAFVKTQIDEPYRVAITVYGQTLAIRAFLRGLKDSLRPFLQTRNPTSLNAL